MSPNDHSLFYKKIGYSMVFLAIYVDDILMTSNNVQEMSHLKHFLDTEFKIKDLGFLNYFLGMEVYHEYGGLIVTQRKFTLDLLKEFVCLGSSFVVSPLEAGQKLKPNDGFALSDPSSYRKLVGKLNYVTHTRPDIAFSVQYLSQFMQSPRSSHIAAVLHTLKYLARDPAQGLSFNSNSSLKLQAYCDSNWSSCPCSRRSMSGYYITFGGSPISWKSKKQPTVSLSSVEAEYISIRRVTIELALFSKFLLLYQFQLNVIARKPYT